MFSIYLSSKKFEMIEFRRKEEEGVDGVKYPAAELRGI
jgi:hypothetical protein